MPHNKGISVRRLHQRFPHPRLALARHQASLSHFAGTLFFSLLITTLAAAPHLLPILYFILSAILLPIRVVKYLRKSWGAFLLDFCYVTNAAVLLVLWKAPFHKGWLAFAYAIAEGPIAMALLAWRCRWSFGSLEHTTSVMIHLLPGLALYAHVHHALLGSGGKGPVISPFAPLFPTLPRGCDSYACLVRASLARPYHAIRFNASWWQVPQLPRISSFDVYWLLVMPLAFYLVWQFVYWLVVQVIFIDKFLSNPAMQTSFKWLTRLPPAESPKPSSWLARFVHRGRSTQARIVRFGAIQLLYTLLTLLLVLPMHHSQSQWFSYQLAKMTCALWFGSRFTVEGLPRRTVPSKKHDGDEEEEDEGINVAPGGEPLSPRRRGVQGMTSPVRRSTRLALAVPPVSPHFLK